MYIYIYTLIFICVCIYIYIVTRESTFANVCLAPRERMLPFLFGVRARVDDVMDRERGSERERRKRQRARERAREKKETESEGARGKFSKVSAPVYFLCKVTSESFFFLRNMCLAHLLDQKVLALFVIQKHMFAPKKKRVVSLVTLQRENTVKKEWVQEVLQKTKGMGPGGPP
jgi:hypothetical protein